MAIGINYGSEFDFDIVKMKLTFFVYVFSDMTVCEAHVSVIGCARSGDMNRTYGTFDIPSPTVSGLPRRDRYAETRGYKISRPLCGLSGKVTSKTSRREFVFLHQPAPSPNAGYLVNGFFHANFYIINEKLVSER